MGHGGIRLKRVLEWVGVNLAGMGEPLFLLEFLGEGYLYYEPTVYFSPPYPLNPVPPATQYPKSSRSTDSHSTRSHITC